MIDPIETPSREECVQAMISHALGVSISFFGPLILWMTAGKRSAFVEKHAKEALNAQITLATVLLACWNFAPDAWFVLLLSGYLILNTVVSVPAVIAAAKGQPFRHVWMPFRLIE